VVIGLTVLIGQPGNEFVSTIDVMTMLVELIGESQQQDDDGFTIFRIRSENVETDALALRRFIQQSVLLRPF
jgi:hypothetical protein